MFWFAFTARSREREPKQLVRLIFLIYTPLNFEKICLYVCQVILRFADMFPSQELLDPSSLAILKFLIGWLQKTYI